MNTEDNAGMKGRSFVGVLDSASAGAGVVVCLGGRAEVGLGSTGEAMARDAFDHDPIFVRDPARSVNGFAVYDGAATYGVVEGTAAAHSWIGLDGGVITVYDEAATYGVVKGTAAAYSWIGLDGGGIAVYDGAATYGVVEGIAAAYSW
jgi:hypothetical protein